MNPNCPVHASYYSPQLTLIDNPFASYFCLCLGSLAGDIGNLVYTQPQHNLPAPSFPVQGTITPPITRGNPICPVHASYYSQPTPIDNPFANYFCLCLGSPETVEQQGDTEVPVYTQSQHNLPAQPSPIQSTIALPVTTMRNRGQCSICSESFPRRQEQERHLLIHVPYFMHCPLPHCRWRGNRANLFRKHWQQEDHRPYHEQYGRTPEPGQIETFDPWVILNQIINGTISLNEGEDQAIGLVQAKADELQKTEIWKDPWGRSRRY